MLAKTKFFATLPYYSLLTNAGPFFTAKDYPDLEGQVWIVTGATSGIGIEIAKCLLCQKAKVYIVGRSHSKLEATVALLKELFPAESVDTLLVDYTDLATIEPAINVFKSKETKLNGIFHNAGVMNVPTGCRTKQNIELTIGVNNVASQYLQNLLDPIILKTPKARIVWISSLAHVMAPDSGFDVNIINKASPETLYAMSKAINYIQAIQWTVNHPDSDVMSIAVHPGIIKSDLTRTTHSFVKTITSFLYYDTPYGALSPLYAALSPDCHNNDYIVPFGRQGHVRPDIYEAARNDKGKAVMHWIDEQIHSNLTP